MSVKNTKAKKYKKECADRKFWYVWHQLNELCRQHGLVPPSGPRKIFHGWQCKLVTGVIVSVFTRKGTLTIGGPASSLLYDEVRNLLPKWSMGTWAHS